MSSHRWSETAVLGIRPNLSWMWEPIKYGVPNGDVHMPQMAGEGDEKTKVISMQDSVICEAWCRWRIA